jgi:hypothetical protein
MPIVQSWANVSLLLLHMTTKFGSIVLKGTNAEYFLMCKASASKGTQKTRKEVQNSHSLFICLLFECLYMSPGFGHCLSSRHQRTVKEESGKVMSETSSSNTHASASFSAFSAKVTLCLAASSDRSLPWPLRPVWDPVLVAVPDPTLPRRRWVWVESKSELPVERRRKNPPIREVPVVVVDALSLGGVVRALGAVVAALSATREDEKKLPRLLVGAVS